MARRLRLLSSERPRDGEAGFALIEVIVAAAVLALVAVAVLGGVDTAEHSAGREKARSVAATLAEQDQERMRSMQVTKLVDFKDSRIVPIDGVNYTVVSEASWTRDDQGATPSCTTPKTQLNSDYLQITTTVTSNVVGKSTNPVKVESLVAPTVAYTSSHGSLAVKVVDRNAAGIEGIKVAASGPAGLPAQNTNQDGCAVWDSVPTGDYTITLDQSGYVDHFGKQQSTAGQTVTANAVAIKTMDYDVASAAAVTIKTFTPGTTASNWTQTSHQVASKAVTVSAVNPGETGLFMTFNPASPPVASLTAASIFPFSSNYSFFTGGCDYDNPATLDPNYFSTYPGAVKVNVPPATNPVTLFQPPLNFVITRNSSASITASGTNSTPLTVKVTPVTPAGETCSDAAQTFTTVAWNGSTGPRYVARSLTGGVPDAGLPFGTYKLCFTDTIPNPDKYYAQAATYDNTPNLGQSSPVSITPSSGWTTSRPSTC